MRFIAIVLLGSMVYAVPSLISTAEEAIAPAVKETSKWFKNPFEHAPKAESHPFLKDPVAYAKETRSGHISTGIWSGIGGAIVGAVVADEFKKA